MTPTPLNLAIHGAAGRMGQRLIALSAADRRFKLVAALEHAEHPRLGEDAGLLAGSGALGIPLRSSLEVAADVLIDFSVPQAALRIAELCRERKIPLVMATTGFSPAERHTIEAAATSIPLLWEPNMSLAVNLALNLTEVAAKALAPRSKDVDVEIIERHHRHKEDAPSGTALRFGEIVAGQMGQSLAAHGREGRPGPRPTGEIGYHAVRAGDHPGEHTVLFGLEGEWISLHVAAGSRDCYARGALAAAEFLVGKPPGRYSMRDVLGL